MHDELSPETIDRAAERYGISLSESERDERLAGVRNLARTAAAFDGEPPRSARPESVRPGEDEYDAFCTRFELAPAESDAPDRRPLAGLEVAVKENVSVAGVETTCGSPGFAYTPPHSATVVERLRDAGGTVVGTTAMDEFAYFTTGETCAHGRIENPAAEGRVPGGSSSGSAAAVAGGLVDAALGTDTAGSIRIPASFCGVVGVKPTHRLVSRFGVIDLSPSLDHVGPLAPDVETAAAVTDAIAGPDGSDPSTHATPTDPLAVGDASGIDARLEDDPEAAVDGAALGLIEEAMTGATDGVQRAIESALERLEAAGADVERVSLEGYDLAGPAAGTIIGAEFAAFVADAGAQYGVGTGTTEPLREALAAATEDCEFGENVRQQLLSNGALNDALEGRHYVAATGFRRRFVATVRDRLAEFDALVGPTTPMTAPAFGEIDGMGGLLRTMENTVPFDLTGSPAVTLPCGAVDGRPVGLQVVTDWYEDRTALRLARAVEAAIDGAS